MFLNPGNVLSWATFFPLLGAAAIVTSFFGRFATARASSRC